MKLRFECDRAKAATNRLKDQVGFDEASAVFRDPLAAIFGDREHSIGEGLLIVSFVEQSEGSVRIVSPRAPTKRERTDHEKGRTG